MPPEFARLTKATVHRLCQAQGRRLFVLGLALLGVMALLIESVRRVAMHVIDTHPQDIRADTALILALCVGFGVILKSLAYLLTPIASILDKRDFSKAVKATNDDAHADEPLER